MIQYNKVASERGGTMRLIDADELLKGHQDHEMISTHLIWNAPTINAVEADLHTDGTLWIKIDHLKGVVAIKNVVLSCSRWCATFVHEEDAVEVVRCKDCNWYKDDGCFFSTAEVKGDDYCSYGERVSE